MTVLGNGSSRDPWPTLQSLLSDEQLLVSTNIDGLYAQRLFTSSADVLANVRSQLSVGLILFLSDAFFKYLDTQARAEREVILDYINKGGRVLAILGPDPLTDRPEFNINRTVFRGDAPEVFHQQVKTWLRSALSSEETSEEYHPELMEILRAAFSPTLEQIPRLAIEEQKEPGINYALYRYTDTILGSINYVLYLPSKIVISRTAERYNQAHFGLTKDQTLLVLVDPKHVGNRDTWMRTIKQNVQATNYLYLDDFLQRRFTISLIPRVSGPTPRIIASRLRRTSDEALITKTFDYIMQRLVEEESGSSAVLLIKGAGGVGKSTLLSYLSSVMQEGGKSDLIVFDATQINTELSETPELRSTFTLFNLIRSMYSGAEVGGLGEKEFAWVFDTGRVSFVIDGIDEIISRIPTLDSLRSFFESVNKYSSHLRKGRIVLTCRSMDSLGAIPSEFGFDVYEMLPFAPEQIDEYLDLRFGEVDRLKREAKSFLSEIGLTFEDGILPFVIRIVCDSIKDHRTHGGAESKLYQASEYLDLSRKLDYIVYKVFDREEAKYEYSKFLTTVNAVDFQANFFRELAVQGRGRCDRREIVTYFKRYNDSFDERVIDRFYDHPLLHAPHIVEFADVAVFEMFLALALHRCLSDRESLHAGEISFMADRGQINSPFVVDVASRIGILTDEVIFQIESILGGCETAFLNDEQSEQYYRSASLLVNVGLQTLMRQAQNDLWDQATALIKSLFQISTNPPVLRYLALHNIPAPSNIRFDFSGLQVENASVVDFADFPRCRFSDTTRFVKSRIRTGMAQRLNTTANEGIFVGCDLDQVFVQSMVRRTERMSNQIEDAKQHVRNFLRIFRLHNSFLHKRQLSTIQGNFTGRTKLSFSATLRICVGHGVAEQEGQEIWIAKRYIDDVQTFVFERHNRAIIDRIIEEVIEKTK